MRFIVAIMDGGWIGFRGAINDWDWSNLKVDLQITRVVKGGGRVKEREREYDGTQADVYTMKSMAGRGDEISLGQSKRETVRT